QVSKIRCLTLKCAKYVVGRTFRQEMVVLVPQVLQTVQKNRVPAIHRAQVVAVRLQMMQNVIVMEN
ncbi:MAG: hypothetical protein ACK5QK_06830, partial [Chryseotalea sp.]